MKMAKVGLVSFYSLIALLAIEHQVYSMRSQDENYNYNENNENSYVRRMLYKLPEWRRCPDAGPEIPCLKEETIYGLTNTNNTKNNGVDRYEDEEQNIIRYKKGDQYASYNKRSKLYESFIILDDPFILTSNDNQEEAKKIYHELEREFEGK